MGPPYGGLILVLHSALSCAIIRWWKAPGRWYFLAQVLSARGTKDGAIPVCLQFNLQVGCLVASKS
jgi:hypothetical protein